MKSKFVALESTSREVEWLRELLADMLLWGKPTPPVFLHYDNQASITVAKHSSYNGKKRHIMRILMKNGVISLDYVKSKRNLVNPLTKGLCKRTII